MATVKKNPSNPASKTSSTSTSKNSKSTMIVVPLDTLQRNDVIFLEKDFDSTPYQVIDTGNPFILIEDVNTHFCHLYRVVKPIYKIQ